MPTLGRSEEPVSFQMTSIGCYETVRGFILKGGLMEFKVIECETFVNNRFRFCVLQTSFFFLTTTCWVLVWCQRVYPVIWKSMKIFLPFLTTYPYRAGFSLHISTNTTDHNRLNTEEDMRTWTATKEICKNCTSLTDSLTSWLCFVKMLLM